MCNTKVDDGLGFKDFKDFNHALRAKQWWRVFQNDKLLSYKILKYHYFPNKDHLQAMLKANSSYMWRSLLAERDLDEKRSIWRISGGKKANV